VATPPTATEVMALIQKMANNRAHEKRERLFNLADVRDEASRQINALQIELKNDKEPDK
jgi:hypothetical protein